MKKKNKPPKQLPEKIWDWFFKPPFYGVPWLVWLYAFLSMFIYLHASGPLTGHLIGFDDHVRMYQVLQWVNGQDWYDRTIRRANLPEGFHTIWPRIVDVPIAFVIIIADLFTDQKTAALIASVVVPYAELALLFVAATYFARPLVGKNNARLMALFLAFSSILNQKKFTLAGFHPGQASHHAWYIILNVVMFGATARVALGVRGRAPALTAGSAIALLLAIGIEGFPMVAGMAALLATLAWGFDDAKLAKRGAEAFTYGAFFSLLLLPVNQPPADWFQVSFAEPSILTPILVGVAALFLELDQQVLTYVRRGRAVHFLILLVLAVLGSAGLIAAFPQILDGAAAALSPAERDMAFHQHPEAWAMYRIADTPLELIFLAMPMMIALIAAAVAVRKAESRRRRILYLCYAGFLIVASGMTQIFWRYYHHAMTASCAWLLWAWQTIKQKLRKNIYHSFISLTVFIALGPLGMLILPAVEDNAPFLTQVAFFPAKVLGPWDACDIRGIAPYIDAHYDTKTNLIVPGDDSAKFLYHTHVMIDFLANFPSQDKFLTNDAFFQTQDESIAKKIALDHRIDLVALCSYLPVTKEVLQSRPNRAPMFMELLDEHTPPPWLKLVTTQTLGNYLLYQVDKEALHGHATQ